MVKKTLTNALNNASHYLYLRQFLAWIGRKFVEIRISWIKNKQITLFDRIYSVNWEDAEYSSPDDYPTFSAFFSRRLKPGVRSIDQTPNTLVFPVDGYASEYGDIKKDTLLQAKGFYYGLHELLGDPTLARTFENGQFITLYLAPHNYHRVHLPFEGRLSEMRYIPGRLFSVSPETAQAVPELFTRNERVVTVFDTDHGPLAAIFVGAGLVGSVFTSWAGCVCPPHTDKVEAWSYPAESKQAIEFDRGEEIGYFALGSTIILLMPEKSVQWQKDFPAQYQVKLGEKMGQWISPSL